MAGQFSNGTAGSRTGHPIPEPDKVLDRDGTYTHRNYLAKGQHSHQQREVSLRENHHGLEENAASHTMVVAIWLELVPA